MILKHLDDFCARVLQIDHPNVLKVDADSDGIGKDGPPFLLTSRVKDGCSLEQVICSGTEIDENVALEVLKLATEVSSRAHQKGIFLLSFPIRHFLLDANGRLFMTGFESAFNPHFCDKPVALDIRKYLQQFSKDTEGMAPEVFRSVDTFTDTIDVFAIGKLLEKVRHLKMDGTSLTSWSDPWKCVAHHCLAEDPAMRFQSSEQVLMRSFL